MTTVESSAVFQSKQWAEKEAGERIENRTEPELVPNQASKSNIVRGALLSDPRLNLRRRSRRRQMAPLGDGSWKFRDRLRPVCK
jgi:hypothetical protein